MEENNTCQACEKEYSRSEAIRSFGDVWWTPLYCSAVCYTNKLMEKNEKKKKPF
ncbi:unnamed protein product, partial [marine sediment metagenome]